MFLVVCFAVMIKFTNLNSSVKGLSWLVVRIRWAMDGTGRRTCKRTSRKMSKRTSRRTGRKTSQVNRQTTVQGLNYKPV